MLSIGWIKNERRMPHRLDSIANYLRPEDIILDVDVATKAELLDAIGRNLEQAHSLSRESISLGLSRREQLGSTGLGQGVAIPHARVNNLDRILVAYLRPKSPIPFDAPDGEPVSDFLVLLVPKEATEEHLVILADASQRFADSRFRARLRQCGDALAVKLLFDTWRLSPSWLQ
jgi:PTS system nitrogen regulatory IIA component